MSLVTANFLYHLSKNHNREGSPKRIKAKVRKSLIQRVLMPKIKGSLYGKTAPHHGMDRWLILDESCTASRRPTTRYTIREGYPTNKKGSTTAFCHAPQRRKLVVAHEVTFQRSKGLRDPKTHAKRTHR
jgi:hypothetical protein